MSREGQMATTDRPATGPAIMEQIVQVRALFEQLAEEARAHWRRDEERMRLVDRFMDPQLNLDLVLKQIIGELQRQKTALENMERTLRAEHHETRTAVAIHMSEP